jgi:carbonic anhydrase
LKYFEYDGTLTTDSYSPVRWIIDDDVLKLNIKDIIRVAKTSRQLQNNDGRIILFKN